MTVIFDGASLRRTLVRLAHEIEEKNKGFSNLVLIGVKRGGEVVARRLAALIREMFGEEIPCAGLDIGMTRDDLVSDFYVPDAERNVLEFSLAGKTVVLCDDVLYSGRTAVAAIEALFRLGRPSAVQLLVLTDRGGRELPVRADFIGKNVPTSKQEYVGVKFLELGDAEDGLAVVSADKGRKSR